MKFHGKNIFVTGGSRGIGKEIVKYLAEKGARVAFTYSQNEESSLELIKSLDSPGHQCFKMDLQSEESVNGCITQVLNLFENQVHGLVNNAGITSDQLLLRMKTEEFDNVINTNLRGVFLVTKAISKVMLKMRSGSMVHITSVIGQTGNQGQANYAASKAGIEAFSKSVALELASRNIRSNCVAPGFIETEMTTSLTDIQKQEIFKKIPLQRIAQAVEVARCVGFLLSDDSSYVTGHTLSVNGGLHMV